MMVAAIEHRTAAAEDSVHRSCETCGDALHPARESRRARRFDQKVDVVVLDRVVNDAEVGPLRTNPK
jgi:hypothetical protein